MNENFMGIVSETMAARGLVNGRGPPRSGGRDSAKRVVSEIIPIKFSPKKNEILCQNFRISIKVCIFVSLFKVRL